MVGEDPDVEIFENEFEELSKANPSFATEEFQEYLKKREAANQKKQELYGDDEPYDAVKDEEFNEEAQLEAI